MTDIYFSQREELHQSICAFSSSYRLVFIVFVIENIVEKFTFPPRLGSGGLEACACQSYLQLMQVTSNVREKILLCETHLGCNVHTILHLKYLTINNLGKKFSPWSGNH